VGEERLGESSGVNLRFSLSTLEQIAKMNFSISDAGDDRPGCQIYSPIPAIEHAMKTNSSQRLKLLKLDFYFTIHGHHQRLLPAEVIWSPLVHLVAESPSLAESAALMSYANRGVLVIIPELPN